MVIFKFLQNPPIIKAICQACCLHYYFFLNISKKFHSCQYFGFIFAILNIFDRDSTCLRNCFLSFFQVASTFSIFFLDFYFPFLFGLLFPFFLWTSISLFLWTFIFPFISLWSFISLIFPFFDFYSIGVTFWISFKFFLQNTLDFRPKTYDSQI